MLINIKSILWMCSTLIAAHALQKGECGNHFLGLIEIKIKVLGHGM